MGRIIIGLAGRIGSGKSELAKVFEENGYKRLFFALPLKKLIGELIGINDINKLNSLKNVEHDYTTQIVSQIGLISKRTGIDENDIKNALKKKTLMSVRDLLQVIGTDIIRQYNPNWHVNKVREMIEDGEYKDYDKIIIDDVRFMNERNLIKRQFGFPTFYIVRPTTNNISHHESEESLQWVACDYFILNDQNIYEFRKKGKTLVYFFENALNTDFNLDEFTNLEILQDESKALQEYREDDYSTLYHNITIMKYSHTMYSKIKFIKNGIQIINGDKDSIHHYTNPLFFEDCKKFYGIDCYTRENLKQQTKMMDNLINETNNPTTRQRNLTNYLKDAIILYIDKAILGKKDEIDIDCSIKEKMSLPEESDKYDEWITQYKYIYRQGEAIYIGYNEIQEGKETTFYPENIENIQINHLIAILNSLKETIEPWDF